MIALFTDFGLSGPYTGQMKAVLAGHAPAVPGLVGGGAIRAVIAQRHRLGRRIGL